MIKSTLSSVLVTMIVMAVCSQARSVVAGQQQQQQQQQREEEQVSAVIPSPNQDFDADEASVGADIIRRSVHPEPQAAAPSNEASVPVYVSPFVRSSRAIRSFEPQESSHAPPNYAPRPATASSIYAPAAAAMPAKDLKTSASYGHHHHGHHGYDHSGWLDMGAWTGGKGSFGWYADYPVGGKHHGYGRK